jgi:FRG domain
MVAKGLGKSIETVAEFVDVCRSLNREQRWIFRGQADNSWKLSSRLERLFDTGACSADRSFKLRDAERLMLREIKRHFHRHSVDAPEEDDNLEWLSLLQHYGAPTRLLDWTFSEYVALFFAISDASLGSQCAIWAVNQKVCWDRLKAAMIPEIRTLLDHDDKDRKATNAILNDCSQSILAPLNPLRLSERLSIQQGTFLVSVNSGISFQESFDISMGEDPGRWLKIVINVDREFLLEAWTTLQRMNITHATLFPGIEGLARSMVLPVILRHLRVQN